MLALSTNAGAILITSSGSLPSPTVVDFSQFSGTFIFSTGPIQIGSLVGENIVWQTNQPSGTTVIGDPSFGLGNNGTWDSGRNGYTALNLETGYMDYLFSNPVNGVGGFMSYAFSWVSAASCSASSVTACGVPPIRGCALVCPTQRALLIASKRVHIMIPLDFL